MRKSRLMLKLLVLILAVALVPLAVLEMDTQLQTRSLIVEKTVVQEQPELTRTIEDLAWRQRIGFIAVLLIVVILAVGVAVMLDRSIVRPISYLQAEARRLLAGQFPMFEIPRNSENELIELAGTLREMSTGLHALVIEAELHSKDMEKLYQEATRRATALETIRSVSQRISTILNIDDLLPEIVELIRAGFDYDRVHLFTIDHVAGELVFRAGAGRAGRVGAEIGERIAISPASTVGQVAGDRQPLLVQDFDREPRYRFSLPQGTSGYMPLPETRAELVVPLSSGGQMIGVLSVQSDRPNTFADEDIFVLQELANQAAGAIVNAQLYEEAFNHAEEIMVLLMTSVAMSTAPDLDVRLEAIAHHARRLMDAEGCTVFRLEPHTNLLRPLISLDPMGSQMMSACIPVGEGITGRVVQTGQGEMVNSPKRNSHTMLVMDPEEQCVLAVPLLVSERTIGAMTVHRRARPFVPHDLELLTMFASQAAVAIENAELYQQLKERAETLQQAYKELEEADKVKDEMIQNISHELRTPLTFIIGYVSLLVEGSLGPLTPQQQESLSLVCRKAHSLNRMVDDIITLQTIRIAQPELKPMDIVPLARRAVEIAEPIAKQAGINILAEIPSLPLWINGEQARLAQVFDNLLNNAIKFSPDGGEVIVRVIDATDEVRVEIQDTGIGIPSDKLEKVFERFYQVDGTATRRFGGMGMGLPICREIIKIHGGRIWVVSPTSGDHGSTFYFTLPKRVVDA